jgi:hypothetical protein
VDVVQYVQFEPVEDEERGAAITQVCAGCNVIENNKMQGAVAGTGAEGGKPQRKDGTILLDQRWSLFRGLDHRNLVHRPGVSEWKIADYVVGDKQAAVIPGAMM